MITLPVVPLKVEPPDDAVPVVPVVPTVVVPGEAVGPLVPCETVDPGVPVVPELEVEDVEPETVLSKKIYGLQNVLNPYQKFQ